MIKILMIGPNTKSRGGIATVFSVYEKKPEIDSIYTYTDGSKCKKFFYYIKSILVFFYKISISNYSHIHVHSASRSSFYRKAMFLFLGKILRKKVVFHLHGGEFDKFYLNESKYLKKLFIKFTLSSCDHILVISSHWKKTLKRIFPNMNIYLLHNPISNIYINTYIDNIQSNNNIIFIGRLDKNKGIEKIVSIFNNVIKNGLSKCRLYFIGEGDRKTILDLAIKLNIQDKIVFTGWLEEYEKIETIKNSFVMIFPSRFETFGMSILEVSAIGIPVVATNVGGIPDIIKDNCNGFLYNENNIDGMTKKIIELYENKKLLANVSEKSKLMSKKFLFDLIFSQYIQILHGGKK